MKFKVGDLVICNDPQSYGLPIVDKIGRIMRIGDFRSKGWTDVLLFDEQFVSELIEEEEEEMGGANQDYLEEGVTFHFNEMGLLPKKTKLNKKLYPTYVEKDGFLMPSSLGETKEKNE